MDISFFEDANPIELKRQDNYIADTLGQIGIEEITSSKERFIKYDEAPSVKGIPAEIVESWKRSKQKGINPSMPIVPYKLSDHELHALLKDKRNFIKDVLNLIMSSMPFIANCAIGIIDKDGVVLEMVGDEKIISGMKQCNHQIGAIWNEESVGTTAHTLSMYLRKPVQLLKESHYCSSIIKDHSLASSAPLIDKNGEILGAVVVVHWFDEALPKNNWAVFVRYFLGWTIALASAFYQQSYFKKRIFDLQLKNRILESGLSLLECGLISMDQEGIIRNVNDKGYKLLGLQPNEIVGKGFIDTFSDAGWVMKNLIDAKPIHNFVTTLKGKSDRQFKLNLMPVINELQQEMMGTIIKIDPAETSSNNSRQRENNSARYTFDNLIGESPKLKKAIETAKIVAKSSGNVLLIGESGTGKELFAQSIHNLYRPEGPFIALNCAAIPKTLIESELFGYEGGSFTGAERKGRRGKIELAQGGTLFLDEIGDLPLELQPVLLRVLEERRFMRVGGTRYIPVDFRVIAATNKDLNKMVEENNFRADLFYRLATFKINIPTLRERKDDINLLSKYLLEKICQKNSCPVPEISPEVQKVLQKYNWPGNIRQLENVLLYAASMAQGGRIELKHLPDELTDFSTFQQNLANGPLSMSEVEKQAIKNALLHCNNNLNEASQILGIGRTTLYRKIKEYKISVNQVN